MRQQRTGADSKDDVVNGLCQGDRQAMVLLAVPHGRVGHLQPDHQDENGGGDERPARSARQPAVLNSFRLEWLDEGDEAVTLACHGLDEPGRPGIVGKRLAQLPDAVVEAAIEIDVDVVSPHGGLQFLTPHQRTRAGDQPGEHNRRLTLERHRFPVPPQLAGVEVDQIFTKLTPPRICIHQGI